MTKQAKTQISTIPANAKTPLNRLGAGQNYPGKSHVIRRSFTAAALFVSGFLMISKTGLCSKRKGDLVLFNEITRDKLTRKTSSTNWPLWIADGTYLVKVQNAINSGDTHGYNAELECIQQCIAAIIKGGTHTIEGGGKKEQIIMASIPRDSK